MPDEPADPGLHVAAEVAQAQRHGRPTVALETTLVTHGFPRQIGLDLAIELEEIVRRSGAVPATIGVLRNRLRVGLTRAELEEIAAAPDVEKLNPSNLAAGIACGQPGSTTVAATLIAAGRSGIKVLATGGIGGVHRDFDVSGDTSADLSALARFPVAVVCSGAKAILDLPRTLEALESFGVPVFGFRTDRFPAFYRRDSGLAVDRQMIDLDDLVRTVATHFDLDTGTGVVVANPISPEHEMPAETYERAIEEALSQARREGVRGRAVTPFLLERLRVATAEQSVFSNRELLRGNVELAAHLAVGLTRRGNPAG